MEMNK